MQFDIKMCSSNWLFNLSVKIAKSGSELKNITEVDPSVEDSLEHADDKVHRESALPCVQFQMVFTAFFDGEIGCAIYSTQKGTQALQQTIKTLMLKAVKKSCYIMHKFSGWSPVSIFCMSVSLHFGARAKLGAVACAAWWHGPRTPFPLPCSQPKGPTRPGCLISMSALFHMKWGLEGERSIALFRRLGWQKAMTVSYMLELGSQSSLALSSLERCSRCRYSRDLTEPFFTDTTLGKPGPIPLHFLNSIGLLFFLFLIAYSIF